MDDDQADEGGDALDSPNLLRQLHRADHHRHRGQQLLFPGNTTFSENVDTITVPFFGAVDSIALPHARGTLQTGYRSDTYEPISSSTTQDTTASFNVQTSNLAHDTDIGTNSFGDPLTAGYGTHPHNPAIPGLFRNEQLLSWTGADDLEANYHPDQDVSMSADHSDLPILGVEQYSAGPPRHRSARSAVIRRPMRSVEAAPRPRPKRALTDEDKSGEPEQDAERIKRSRGRPRLQTTDESAAERRRTQIRLAQRAYRNRKDAAITVLEEKVKDLEKANDDIGKEFNRLHDLALSKGMLDVAPELADSLKAMAEKLLALKQTPGTEGSDSGSTTCGPKEHNPEKAESSRGEAGNGAGLSGQFGDFNTHSQSTPMMHLNDMSLSSDLSSYSFGQSHHPSSTPYEVITQATPDNASFPMYIPMNQQPFDFFHSPHHSPYSGLPIPRTYAFNEPTFGKRLQRTAAEAGLRLASMPNPPPERFAAVFGFSLLFETREAIIARLSSGLRRSRHESLNIWSVPFTNLGGSGLFFDEHSTGGRSAGDDWNSSDPPLGNHGMREVRKPQEINGYSMGPFNDDVEEARDLVDGKMRMKYLGFEGDFYDSEEVEIYLRKRGIIIPAQADFVDVEIDPRQLNGDEQAPSPGLPVAESLYGDLGQADSTPESHAWTSAGGDASSLSGLEAHMPLFRSRTSPGASQLDAGVIGTMCPPIPQDGPSSPTRIKAVIDVQTLIFEIVGKSVCVGRTSAIRPRDIDRAVKLASGLEFGPLYKPVSVLHDSGIIA